MQPDVEAVDVVAVPADDRVRGRDGEFARARAARARSVQYPYKERRVLRGVDIDVARGSIFALLGSNGAGKATVVKILSTLLKADAGTARVNGFDVATHAALVRSSS